jgi:CRISPR-associated protein Cas2
MKLRLINTFELALVGYDSPDDKRRRRVAELLEGFGTRLQWSLFACWILPGERPRLIRMLEAITSPQEDRLVVIPISASTQAQTTHIGTSSWQPPPAFRLIGDFEPQSSTGQASPDQATPPASP